MHIVIVGAGIIGANLAKTLSEEGHRVYLLEHREEISRKIDERLDVKVVLGSGTDPGVLRRARIEAADLVVAVTPSDEINVVVCLLAAQLGAKRRIARVRSQALNREIAGIGCARFALDEIINPEELAAEGILKTLATPGAREVAEFAEGRILLRAFDVPETSPLCGLTIGELGAEDFPWPFLIVAVLRKGEARMPHGDTYLQAGDRIYVLLPHGSLGEFLSFVDPDVRMPQKVVLYGATTVGVRVAEGLAVQGKETVLIEEDGIRAFEAASDQAEVRIIQGAAGEKETLVEAGIEAADAFIAASANDHANLVSAVLARRMGARTTIIVTHHPDYLAIADELKIDAIVNPRLLAVHQILRLVRGGGIRSVSKLLDGRTEAIEFIPEDGAPVTRGSIKDLAFPKDVLVGAVCRGEDVLLAKGETRILPGERVIVFCRREVLGKVQRMFSAGGLFRRG